MRERDEKKDSELEQLRLTLYDLEDAILQQIAMKKYAEQVKILEIIFICILLVSDIIILTIYV